MIGPAALLANLGAEEGDGWRRSARLGPVRDAAALWALLFPSSTPRVDAVPAPESLAPWLRTGTPALEPLRAYAGALVPWLSTGEAAALARGRGLRLGGADPGVVRRVHDKAFALEHARGQGSLEDACAVLEPGPADALAEAAEAHVASWPGPWRARFALKPRLGTTGRGRIAGVDGRVDREALRRAPPGAGFVLEPWVERLADASTQLWIETTGEVRVLGQLWLGVAPDGRCVAFTEARPDDPGPLDLTRACDAAVRLAGAAAHEGYTGPCSVDALAWRDAHGSARTRAVLELNARHTLGGAALGAFARARAGGLVLSRPRLGRAARPPAPGAVRIVGDWWLEPDAGGAPG